MTSPEEIWSMRLQRELLALSESGEDEKDIGVLPPFITVKDHTLDISKGRCTVSFAVTVEGVARDNSVNIQVDAEAVDKQLGEKDEDTDCAIDGQKGTALGGIRVGNEQRPDTVMEEASDMMGSNEQELAEGDTDAAAAKKIEPKTITEDGIKFKVQVIITLDASLRRYQSLLNASRSYPFFKPSAFLTSGAEHFPSCTNLMNGDEIQIDCDWTPSLHLNDAAMNIALKVRESIKRGEPCLKAEMQKDDSILSEVAADINKGAHKVASFFSDLKDKASAVAEELDQAVSSKSSNTNTQNIHTAASVPPSPRNFRRKVKVPAPPKKVVTVDNIEIGDELDLSTDPWNRAIGMYPSKAIRRPDFVVAAMEAGGQNSRNASAKVAGAGLSGAGSMFRSFTKSAKSLVEESFLMLTDELIIEISCNKFSVANATVSFAIPVSHLAKLKFRREESISLFFKQAPDDPIVYMCASSADAVKQVQNILRRHGVKGKHTNATMQKTVQAAMQMIEDIKVMEQKLEVNPSREQVTIIMDLYRQAAEKFELAGDARHEEVMAHMRDFLARPHVASILDGSYDTKVEVEEVTVEDRKSLEEVKEQEPAEKKEEDVKAGAMAATTESAIPGVNEGKEVHETEGSENFEEAMRAAENMLNDAIGDFDDVEDNVLPTPANANSTNDIGTDVVSEFEDMLKDADKELQELMGA